MIYGMIALFALNCIMFAINVLQAKKLIRAGEIYKKLLEDEELAIFCHKFTFGISEMMELNFDKKGEYQITFIEHEEED